MLNLGNLEDCGDVRFCNGRFGKKVVEMEVEM
jgi:hypothetical protein